jgi:hypothetical protein
VAVRAQVQQVALVVVVVLGKLQVLEVRVLVVRDMLAARLLRPTLLVVEVVEVVL